MIFPLFLLISFFIQYIQSCPFGSAPHATVPTCLHPNDVCPGTCEPLTNDCCISCNDLPMYNTRCGFFNDLNRLMGGGMMTGMGMLGMGMAMGTNQNSNTQQDQDNSIARYSNSNDQWQRYGYQQSDSNGEQLNSSDRVNHNRRTYGQTQNQHSDEKPLTRVYDYRELPQLYFESTQSPIVDASENYGQGQQVGKEQSNPPDQAQTQTYEYVIKNAHYPQQSVRQPDQVGPFGNPPIQSGQVATQPVQPVVQPGQAANKQPVYGIRQYQPPPFVQPIPLPTVAYQPVQVGTMPPAQILPVAGHYNPADQQQPVQQVAQVVSAAGYPISTIYYVFSSTMANQTARTRNPIEPPGPTQVYPVRYPALFNGNNNRHHYGSVSSNYRNRVYSG